MKIKQKSQIVTRRIPADLDDEIYRIASAKAKEKGVPKISREIGIEMILRQVILNDFNKGEK